MLIAKMRSFVDGLDRFTYTMVVERSGSSSGCLSAIGYLLHRNVLISIGIGLELINVEDQNVTLDLGNSQYTKHSTMNGDLTSMRQKLGVGSSSSEGQAVEKAPVALPGLTKNLPSNS